MAFTVGELAKQCGGRVQGDATRPIEGVASLIAAGPTDIAYVASPKYRTAIPDTRAGAVLLTADDADLARTAAIIVDNPRLAFANIATLLRGQESRATGVHASAVVHERAHVPASAWIGPHVTIDAGARIGERVSIGPGCHIAADAVIGDDCRLAANVSVGRAVRMGRRCSVEPGAVIGSEGFGYVEDGERWVKIPQLGGVVIGDDVDIGANTTIDRGALDDTLIGDGVKLDNLIQIAHNVQIGDHTAMAGCVGIAGSAVIGKRCTIGGGVGIAGHLEIGDDVHVTGMSLVGGSIPAGQTYSSSMSAEPVQQWRKNAARFRQLDDIVRRLRRLEQKTSQNPEGDVFE